MRWPKRGFPRGGEQRTRRQFLLFPRCIQNEWRWLEHACWREYWQIVRSMSSNHHWVAFEWVGG